MSIPVYKQHIYIDNGNSVDIVCGRDLYWCSNCNASVNIKQRFCRSCGKDLDFKNCIKLKDKRVKH